jgi:hypothetical protein
MILLGLNTKTDPGSLVPGFWFLVVGEPVPVALVGFKPGSKLVSFCILEFTVTSVTSLIISKSSIHSAILLVSATSLSRYDSLRS